MNERMLPSPWSYDPGAAVQDWCMDCVRFPRCGEVWPSKRCQVTEVEEIDEDD